MRKIIIIIAVVAVTILFSSFYGCKVTESVEEAIVEETTEDVEETTEDVEETTEADLAGTRITVLATADPHDVGTQEVLADFEAETGIIVDFEQIGVGEQMTKSRLELSKGSSQYDVLMISSYDSVVFYSNGWCEDLDELEKSTGISFNRDTFLPGILESTPSKWEGTTVGLPYMVATNGILMYRKDLIDNQIEKDAFMEKYGYELAPPTNYDQYFDVSEFFTRDTDNDGEIDFYGNAMHLDPGGSIFDQWISRYISGDMEADADPEAIRYLFTKDFQPRFNNEAGVKAIEDIKILYEAGYTYPGALSMTWSTLIEPFRIGGAFMALDWAEDLVPGITPDNEFPGELEWAPLPFYSNPRIFQGGWAATINKNSNNKEAAYRFIVWLTSEETEYKILTTGTYWDLPVRQNNIDNPEVLEGFESYQVIGEMLESYEALGEQSTLPEIDIVSQVLNVELQRVVAGEKTGKEALDDAAEAIVEDLTEAGVYDRLE